MVMGLPEVELGLFLWVLVLGADSLRQATTPMDAASAASVALEKNDRLFKLIWF
jgi:hypothetical protein